jgi:hypothetical protein
MRQTIGDRPKMHSGASSAHHNTILGQTFVSMRATVAKPPTKNEARRIAANIAKLPEL